MARLLTEDGRVETKISHEHWFDDPDSHQALVQANEKATELRAIAQQLNDEWTAARKSQLLGLQAQYEKADAQAASATGLQQIVDAEADCPRVEQTPCRFGGEALTDQIDDLRPNTFLVAKPAAGRQLLLRSPP